ncbi:Zinc finger, RING-type,Zinc finger, RING/FYVE/PHD-type,Zinc finger, RING-type, conserved site [Cinara cedri]|uniref:Zinc finger, RING-type,Zinc finger, RING/FYVE/PHD-type,Zinc finger, RING-type, conserved site n=1 Tax=Cinara cedri TaxID=506608 RepID=A0A5E4MW73_9HEMI|nr:Zinc finger, RING-type,Zinc finger, RING/FYVE/PHD-type,Zinc finger, RING-type, conserved site [Cinara cedri]
MGSSRRTHNMGINEAAEFMMSNQVNLKKTINSALLCINCKRTSKDWVVLFKCRHIICKVCINKVNALIQTANDPSMRGKSRCPACNVIYTPETDMKNQDGMKQHFKDLKQFHTVLRANIARQQRNESTEPANNSQVKHSSVQVPRNKICGISNGAASTMYKALVNPTTDHLQNVGSLSLNDGPSSSSSMDIHIPKPEQNTNDEITTEITEIKEGDEDLKDETPDKHD